MTIQTVSGSGAIAVQIEGNDNRVEIIAGGARLVLNRLHLSRNNPKTILELLRADIRAIDLVGRQDELSGLANWRNSDLHVAVRCITGRAGSGKTRLAIEACERAEADGWTAAFVSSEELKRFHQTQNLANWRLPANVLLVIDYAATSLDIIKPWFADLASGRHTASDGKLRILLLERQADPQSGWWESLTRRDSRDHACAADLLDNELPQALPALVSIVDRRALLESTMAKAAPLLAKSVKALPVIGVDPTFDKLLARDLIENEPLYLLMAGVYAVQHGAPTALGLGRPDLAEAMATIERKRIERLAQSRTFRDNGDFLAHLVAYITLRGGCPLGELEDLIRHEMAPTEFKGYQTAQSIACVLCECLPETLDGRLDAIRPDLIGEVFAVKEITGPRTRSESNRLAVVKRALAEDEPRVIDTLIRASQDLAEGSADHISVRWLQAIVQNSGDFDQLISIESFLPQRTLALRELALMVSQRIVAIIGASGQNDHNRKAELARWLTNLANRLGDVGRREDALEAARECVALYRVLAVSWPDDFAPHLAMSINNLSGRLSDVGRREDALETAQEAVNLYSSLAVARPDTFTPDLAMALSNLANHLSATGRREEAFERALEAVNLYRVLVTVTPQVFIPDLANSLTNLANRLGAVGRKGDAVEAAREAVDLHRSLAAVLPDAFTPDLARSLSNLSRCLGDIGRREDALEVGAEVIGLYRVLAAARPGAFTLDLAKSLNNYANRLSAVGRREDALNAALEAVPLHRELVTAQPEAFTPYLANLLINLAVKLSDVGRKDEALQVASESVDLCRTLTRNRPDVFIPDLALSLSNFANRLTDVGHKEEALEVAREAVMLRRVLTAERPDVFTADLAMSLNNLANFLNQLGQREEGLAVAREAADLYRTLTAASSDAFTADLAMSLGSLANSLNQLGQGEEGLEVAQEAVDHYRTLTASRPDVFTPNLAVSLSVLADALELNDHTDQAIAYDREAVSTLSPYFLARPVIFAERIVPCIRRYIRRSETAGIEVDANLLAPIISCLEKLEDK